MHFTKNAHDRTSSTHNSRTLAHMFECTNVLCTHYAKSLKIYRSLQHDIHVHVGLEL